ncbi:MAG: alpha-ketoglutarate-dependent dioxygenase AlkB [Pseudomonadota bacterium]
MSQASLFDDQPAAATRQRLAAADAEFDFFANAFSAAEADRYLACLLRQTPWRQDQILIHGKRIPLPRLQAWYSDDAIPLSYSGMHIEALPLSVDLNQITRRVEELCETKFNGVLVTLYRDGNDSVGWHSDDEAEFGSDPIIASVSFGATRDFVIKHRRDATLAPIKWPLTHGSLLLMGSGSQLHWTHHLPKRKRVTEPRINLTLRQVQPI